MFEKQPTTVALVKSTGTVSGRPGKGRRSRRLQTFLTLLEDNFDRLQDILGGIELHPGAYASTATGDLAIVLAVLARSRYTTELAIGYRKDQSVKPDKNVAQVHLVAAPVLNLRIYHDAKLVEVVEDRKNPTELNEDQRWQLNLMLAHWLRRMQWHEHRFNRLTYID